MITGRVWAKVPVLWIDLAVLAVAVIWGASYPVAKGALAYAPVMVLILYRFLITSVVMTLLSWRGLRGAAAMDLVVGAILGTILFCIFVAETWGMSLTSATNAALIISLCIIFTPFLDYGLRGQLPPATIFTGAALAVAGTAILTGGLSAPGPGDALILVAAGLRAVMVVATKRLMLGRRLSSSALTAVQATVVATLTAAVLLTQAGPQGLVVQAGAGFWAAIMFLSLFCTIVAFYVQNAAVRQTSPTRVSLLMGTEPLFGFALAWLMLSEPAGPGTVAGAVLISVGTFIALMPTGVRAARPDPRPGIMKFQWFPRGRP